MEQVMKKLMNEENEWDRRISTGVKEGPADCIRISEVDPFRSLAVLDPRVGHNMDVLSPFIPVLCHSD